MNRQQRRECTAEMRRALAKAKSLPVKSEDEGYTQDLTARVRAVLRPEEKNVATFIRAMVLRELERRERAQERKAAPGKHVRAG